MFPKNRFSRPLVSAFSVVETQLVEDPDTGIVSRKDVDLTKVKLPDSKMTDLSVQLKAGVPLDRVPVQKVVNTGKVKAVAVEIEKFNMSKKEEVSHAE